ncbi:uncharacterized protein LOC122011901 [Zingiber officinale]|nr:uncharacterized protein LOC122011901 [Zingiber officinale]
MHLHASDSALNFSADRWACASASDLLLLPLLLQCRRGLLLLLLLKRRKPLEIPNLLDHQLSICVPNSGSRHAPSMDSRKGKGRRKQRSPITTTTTTLLCCSLIAFFSLWSLFATARSDLGNPTRIPRVQGRRRGLGGGSGRPGSYPPLCAAKCGACSPCNPVHEAVRPGQPAVEEYYPEAWRCKCANKLYMP